jgi:Flp pilus assembly pilin Flp
MCAKSEESRVVPSTVQPEAVLSTLPDHAKGGELVLKLFAFTQAFVGSTVHGLGRREAGQTMAEYGVVLAVITLAVVAAISLLSDNVRNASENVAGVLPG